VAGHAVHQNTTTKGPGGDIAGEWAAANNATVEWLTFGVPEVHDRVFREASLAQGGIDVAFLLNRFTDENIANLFVPLDDYLASDPIPEFDGISKGMLEAFTFDGKIYAIPFRHATHGLLYNETFLAERGLDGPPETFEEFIDYARQLTYTREDGTRVHGVVWGGLGPANLADLVRAHGGDFITSDLEVKVNSPGTVKAIELLVDFFQNGVVPQSELSFSTEDAITYMQQGRAAMAIAPFGRYVPFNDPEASKFPGSFKAIPVPSFAGQPPIAVKTEVWAIAIPANAPNKDMSWSFIKHLSTADAALRAALNGNGPVRSAVYDDPRMLEIIPYAEAEGIAVESARVPLPGFSKSAEADDAIIEAVQEALLGAKTAQQAMDDLQRRLEAMIAGN
jgi:multiple sugar transport system substrate-binding protein